MFDQVAGATAADLQRSACPSSLCFFVFTKCTKLPENIRNRAKARRQPNSSTLSVAPCLKSPLSLHPNYYTASTQYLTHGQWQKLPLIWKNRRNGSQRCVGFISQTFMPEKLKESQPPTRHREWKILCEKCNNSYHTWRRR